MSAPPAQRPAAVPGWAAPAPPRTSFWHPAFYLAIVYIVFTYTRFAEIFAMVTHRGVRLALVINLLAIPVILLSGGILHVLRSRIVMALLAFTAWFCLAIPFSVWRGGSVSQLMAWLLSLVSVVLLAVSIEGFDQCRKAMYALAVSVMAIELAGFFLGTSAIGAAGRFTLEQGTLANPNDLATLLLMGLPGCVLVVRTKRGISILKMASWVALFLVPLTVVRTGSRGGLLALGTLFVVYFFSVPALRKLQLGLGALAVLVVSLLFVNREALDRYKMMFVSSNPARYQDSAEESAVESSMSRKQLFLRSVRMSFEHPLLGVGPGMFQVADAQGAEQNQYYAYWRQTHNTFTQISSEEGFPALLLYCAAIFFCFRATRAAGKLAKAHAEVRWVGDLAFTLRLSVLAFVITGVFASNAYYFYFPIVAGLCAALERAVAVEGKALSLTPASPPEAAARGR
jgi:O-Antigen ligase